MLCTAAQSANANASAVLSSRALKATDARGNGHGSEAAPPKTPERALRNTPSHRDARNATKSGAPQRGTFPPPLPSEAAAGASLCPPPSPPTQPVAGPRSTADGAAFCSAPRCVAGPEKARNKRGSSDRSRPPRSSAAAVLGGAYGDRNGTPSTAAAVRCVQTRGEVGGKPALCTHLLAGTSGTHALVLFGRRFFWATSGGPVAGLGVWRG